MVDCGPMVSWVAAIVWHGEGREHGAGVFVVMYSITRCVVQDRRGEGEKEKKQTILSGGNQVTEQEVAKWAKARTQGKKYGGGACRAPWKRHRSISSGFLGHRPNFHVSSEHGGKSQKGWTDQTAVGLAGGQTWQGVYCLHVGICGPKGNFPGTKFHLMPLARLPGFASWC